MIKNWEIKASPAQGFGDRKILLLSADDIKDIGPVKESFTGNIGVIFKSGDKKYPYAAYIYGASPSILNLIQEEMKVLSGSETLQVEPEAVERGKIEEELIPATEKLAPDESGDAPLRKPVIKYFEEEKKQVVSGKKNKPPLEKKPEIIRVVYLCPEGRSELLSQVQSSINRIMLEKGINFNFAPAAEILYKKTETSGAIVSQITGKDFNFVLSIAPDEQIDPVLRELREKKFILKIITEDNIDKKFRYLNLITDIVLSHSSK